MNKDLIDRGAKLVENSMIYGKLFSDLTRDEAIAMAALGWDNHRKQIEAVGRDWQSTKQGKSK